MGECDRCGRYCKEPYSLCYSCYKESKDDDSWEYEEHSFSDWGEELRQNSLNHRLENPSPLEIEFKQWLLILDFIDAGRSWLSSKLYPYQLIREYPWNWNNRVFYYDFCLYLKSAINISSDSKIPIYNHSDKAYPRMLLFELDGQEFHQTIEQKEIDQIKTNEAHNLLTSYKNINKINTTQFFRIPGKEILSGEFKSKIIMEL
jgi:hypothetical protein